MAKLKRQLLKFREGDCGLKIRKDGQLEVAGVDEKHGIIDAKGMVNPALLFASAWARRDPKVFQALIDNFKESVKEGYFGPDAKRDYEIADKLKEEKKEEEKKPLKPFLNPDFKPTIPASKPTVSVSVKQRMKLQDAASGAVTFEQPAAASGAVTIEQTEPLDVKGVIDRRDS
jgi:hypothetical protein